MLDHPLTFKRFITKPQNPPTKPTPTDEPYNGDIRALLERTGHAHIAEHDEVKSFLKSPFNNQEGK